ncbi:methyltransferase [Virgibacillus pantothenticus]|uniref:50S rRNA methyltransferase n=1 Tax=Virgibacillus pantothenticus TaxID=1473 RepID=A0A0L0QL37_VIRPA|nr:class I SAM-dependent rRNA methyltransferase [Virgibacillus pantothenticus]KNE18973.1 50S rRNA methyltransferase [Virgibacillus pantothenticus]MBU8565271.1 class I SAM-dependent rRNA methyltransferase [Virgibacillus pantothenticus]MBU8599510.1 class I SAM-dependent rRNA methyltransferase [Virgibacillus pantothenticus]MBU8633590.1 class I SAM-dependent rRNA methyltransferase [Virgibacillus pantothenticus]MBU8641790.1 class I SAM-dependent rRNA methyltransferase [Virgibacillus pantothenticus]
MRKEITLQVDDSYIKQLRQGYPLIHQEAVKSKQPPEEGAVVKLVDSKHRFIARGYYGKQNKGIGWVLTYHKDEMVNAKLFQSKILTAINKRQGFYQSEDTNAFRVFNGEGDGIGGLTIDYYAGYYLINWYSEGIYSFKDDVVRALDVLGNYYAIYEKKRFHTQGKYLEDDDFVKGERGLFPIIVKENGMHYAVYLNDGAMTGIFLDQRDVRKAIRDTYAKGKQVLNTFSYTGAFSVAAALGGAEKTISVDLAKRSKPKTMEQFSINGIDFDQHEIIVMDVFDYFKYARRKQLQYDLVIVDPPSFARSKKRTFSTTKDYPALLTDVISITKNHGIIVASTNNASFGMKKFKGFIRLACQKSQANYKILEQFQLPSDFQTNEQFIQSNYLKVCIIQIQKNK